MVEAFGGATTGVAATGGFGGGGSTFGGADSAWATVFRVGGADAATADVGATAALFAGLRPDKKSVLSLEDANPKGSSF
jgi:hypothetical protein